MINLSIITPFYNSENIKNHFKKIILAKITLLKLFILMMPLKTRVKQ